MKNISQTETRGVRLTTMCCWLRCHRRPIPLYCCVDESAIQTWVCCVRCRFNHCRSHVVEAGISDELCRCGSRSDLSRSGRGSSVVTIWLMGRHIQQRSVTHDHHPLSTHSKQSTRWLKAMDELFLIMCQPMISKQPHWKKGLFTKRGKEENIFYIFSQLRYFSFLYFKLKHWWQHVYFFSYEFIFLYFHASSH